MKQALVYRDGGKREVDTAAASNDCRFLFFVSPEVCPRKTQASLDLHFGIRWRHVLLYCLKEMCIYEAAPQNGHLCSMTPSASLSKIIFWIFVKYLKILMVDIGYDKTACKP